MLARTAVTFAACLSFAVAGCTVIAADAPPPDAQPVTGHEAAPAAPAPVTAETETPTATPAAKGDPKDAVTPSNPATPSTTAATTPATTPGPKRPTGPAATRDCPDLQCSEECKHGVLNDARGCPSCLCRPESGTDPGGRGR
jgi:Antistasin family